MFRTENVSVRGSAATIKNDVLESVKLQDGKLTKSLG